MNYDATQTCHYGGSRRRPHRRRRLRRFQDPRCLFTPSGTYNGTVNQLQEPSKSDSISDARNTAVVQAAKKVSPAVVGITTKVYNRDMFNRKVLVGEGVGSGVIFDKAGYIVTNNHVVGTAKTVIVSWPMARVPKGLSSAAMKRRTWPSSRSRWTICPSLNLATAIPPGRRTGHCYRQPPGPGIPGHSHSRRHQLPQSDHRG